MNPTARVKKIRTEIVLDTTADFKNLVKVDTFRVCYRKKNGQWKRGVGHVNVVNHPETGALLIKGTLDENVKEERNDLGVVNYYDDIAKGYRQFKLGKMRKLMVRGESYYFGVL